MTREEILQTLKNENPRGSHADMTMYADYFFDYQEAQENITKNGTIVAHPRTGSPIENPYVKIKATCVAQLMKIGAALKVNVLWGGPAKASTVSSTQGSGSAGPRGSSSHPSRSAPRAPGRRPSL